MSKAVSKPIEWERANPHELATFDPSTKMCTMNCGPHRQDPRTEEERKFLCDECLTQEPAMSTIYEEGFVVDIMSDHTAQLEKFCNFEYTSNRHKVHVAQWAMNEIRKLRAENERLRDVAQRPAKHDEEHAMVAWSLAGQLLKQAQAENETCAYWFVSALSKLASSHPKRPIIEVLALVMNAMPKASKMYRDYVAEKC